MPHNIGIYVRVSTDEQANVVEGSIESQQHRLKAYVDSKNSQESNWGKVVETYIEDGYSAGTTARPAYQKMMRDVRTGKVNLILITDLSRLSRSIDDFSDLQKELNLHKAKFLSVKEQFDTSTPAGEMMIYMLINLAQFERKQTAERISLNMNSRALRGLLNGGAPLLGYDKDPNNKGTLIPNPSEIPTVKKLFDAYLIEGSLQAAARKMNEYGIGPKVSKTRNYRHAKNGKWNITSVRSHLKNMAYIGQLEVNRKYKNDDQTTLKNWQKYQIVQASWPAIIDQSVFERVQLSIAENRNRERGRFINGKGQFFLLSGLLSCAECGRALTGQSSHGRGGTYRYYGHKIVVGETFTCKANRLRAPEVEQAVVDHLTEIMSRAGHLDKIEAQLLKTYGGEVKDAVAEKELIRQELISVNSEIESIFKLYTALKDDPSNLEMVKIKLSEMSSRKQALVQTEERLEEVLRRSSDASEARLAIEDRVLGFTKGWFKANSKMKRKLIRSVIQSLIFTSKGLLTYFVINEEQVGLPPPNIKKAPESNSGALPNILSMLFRRPTGSLLSSGASIVSIGGAGEN
jgi:site-specific DNA recombinase